MALGLRSPVALSLGGTGDQVGITQEVACQVSSSPLQKGAFRHLGPWLGLGVTCVRRSHFFGEKKPFPRQGRARPSFPRARCRAGQTPSPGTPAGSVSAPTSLPTTPWACRAWPRPSWGSGTLGGVQSCPESRLCGLEGGALASWGLLSKWGKVPLQVSCGGELPHSALYTGPSNCHTPSHSGSSE